MTVSPSTPESHRPLRPWVYEILLVYILLAAAYFRFTGLYWGEFTYMHPDERFLVWVGSDINPVNNLQEYFDTANSSLNPHNRGHGFYVYGTLPMFLARYMVEWIFGHSGFEEMTQVGRALSAVADLFTVLLVYLVAGRLFNRRVAVLAAAFSAAVVLQIQQAHFFTMDAFLNALMFLAFYFAVRVLTDPRPWQGDPATKYPQETPGDQVTGSADSETADPARQQPSPLPAHWHLFWPSLGFGIALGLAMATKVNALPMAFALPAALSIGIIKLPSWREREKMLWKVALYLLLAAVTSLVVFRLFQPYAFQGPGFFGLKLNPQWLSNMNDQAAQRGGDVDFPPNMQWARRPVWFSAQNLVIWGLGLPLGILAWAGFLWSGWIMFSSWRRGQPDWQAHFLTWFWTAIYFTWQSLQRNPTMRYQLPIYPTLVIFAAWAIFAWYDPVRSAIARSRIHWNRVLAAFTAIVVLLTTYAYAFAFTQMYVRPFTRVAASRWIYQNISGPISLLIDTDDGVFQQPLSVPYRQVIAPGLPYQGSFEPRVSGQLVKILFPHILDQTGNQALRTLNLSITRSGENEVLATATLTADFSAVSGSAGDSFTLDLDQPLQVTPGERYNLKLELPGDAPAALSGELTLNLHPSAGGETPVTQPVDAPFAVVLPNLPYSTEFTASLDGDLIELFLSNSTITSAAALGGNLRLQLDSLTSSEGNRLSALSLVPPGTGLTTTLVLEQRLSLLQGQRYRLTLQLQPEGGALALSGVAIANEGDWDDGLPLRMDGYDGYGGIYPPELNLNMYWDDNTDKLERFVRILDQAEYVVISSNRQWGSLPRIPERFPLTTEYYRQLLGCPPEMDVVTCYRVAQPGMFQGELGFELVRVFESPPSLAGITLNDQFAEEAFTVYDHPKVLIFKKTADYRRDVLQSRLEAVDLTYVVRIPPMRYGPQPANLLLPADRLAQQQQGGTWAELFNPDALVNRSQAAAVILWYLTITLLGLAAYPLLRLAVPGLSDRGYPLARIAGLLISAYLVWMSGSFGIAVSRGLITLAYFALLALGALAAYFQRKELLSEIRQHGRYFLAIEGLALGLFLAFLLVRLGNPDLWHPWKGGEKPMDFSYFNAILKSTTFPPYDPWYAGGYLNYYYYGFVMVGMPVKWLGITPAVAYNLLLPTMFSLLGLGAFSLGWNLSQLKPTGKPGEPAFTSTPLTWLSAAAGTLGLVILGNLGTVVMIYKGYQRLGSPDGVIDQVNLFTGWVWAIRGFFETLQGASLPYGIGDWYWLPSRAIPAPNDVEPITEFPLFTLLYGDPHAHLWALPVTLLALTLAIAIVFGQARWKSKPAGLVWFLLTALAIGALRSTNTWDFPPYLALALVAIGYTLWRNPPGWLPRQADGKVILWARITLLLGALAGLTMLTIWLYQPYSQWYLLGYDKINLWKGTHTPLRAYLWHWGLFLFIITSWMAWETRHWLAHTPVSALRKLIDSRQLILLGLLLLLGLILGLLWLKVQIAWFVLLLAAWAGVLLLQPGQPVAKQMVLFLVGTALTLTLMVEVIVLVGDIGRMNTVFKFYLQAWTMFAISAAAALGWTASALAEWIPGWRRTYQVILALLVAGAGLYTLTATMAKIDDRMVEQAPHTLDGMAYMPYATYVDEWGSMVLEQDYRAILWLQQNVQGSPVIVEANLRNLYRWGSRMTIYTGLPGVVGWEWHQQQQRAALPGTWVSARISEIDNFYTTTDLSSVSGFLEKYEIRYIIVGQQERGHYAGPGLEKFEDLNGLLWDEVFRYQDTVIYAVSEAGT